MQFPCRTCITQAICNNREPIEKFDLCHLYADFLQQRGWKRFDRQLYCTYSQASTTTIRYLGNGKYEGVTHDGRKEMPL